jgi:hypothetical protein
VRVPREQVASALFNQVLTLRSVTTPIITSSRRVIAFDQDTRANWPALYLQQLDDVPETKHINLTRWEMQFFVWIYLPVPEDRKIPVAPLLNAYKDALEKAVQGVPPGTPQTLGGLVTNVAFSGPIITVEGLAKPPAILCAPLSVLCGV